MLFTNSCHKTYTCTFDYYTLECIKGNDTIYNTPDLSIYVTSGNGQIFSGEFIFSRSYINNLVSYYKANGYTVIEHPVPGTGAAYGVSDLYVKAYEANDWICK